VEGIYISQLTFPMFYVSYIGTMGPIIHLFEARFVNIAMIQRHGHER